MRVECIECRGMRVGTTTTEKGFVTYAACRVCGGSGSVDGFELVPSGTTVLEDGRRFWNFSLRTERAPEVPS